ncbi:hypothetical protein R1sor_007480 [Riccia sorocarpa]|uniref:Uncharacterized protein n=1 Tax=Riccia sorocarpa TaxID=122646 RepID=A0ABD3HWW7_9MARC
MEQVAVRSGQRRPVMIIDAGTAPTSQLQISGPPQLIRTKAQQELAAAIERWCAEKGTDLFLDQLLQLVDTEFLRTTHGDDRYFDDVFHSKVKAVWPDDETLQQRYASVDRKEVSADSPSQPAEVEKEVSIPIVASQHTTCIVRCVAQVFVHPHPAPAELSERKRRRLPSWSTQSSPPVIAPESTSSTSSESSE